MLIGAFNQEKALVGAFSVIVKTGYETDGSFYSTKQYVVATDGPQQQHGHQQPTLSIIMGPVTCQHPTFFLEISSTKCIVVHLSWMKGRNDKKRTGEGHLLFSRERDGQLNIIFLLQTLKPSASIPSVRVVTGQCGVCKWHWGWAGP